MDRVVRDEAYRDAQAPVGGYTGSGRQGMEGSATAGIATATPGSALDLLQWANRNGISTEQGHAQLQDEVQQAALEVASYHNPTTDQARRHQRVAGALAAFLDALVANCPPGPERSTAISRAREAKMWASAGIALEGR